MRNALALALVVLAPGVAHAHPGHEHVGSEAMHHGFEFAIAAAVAVVAGVVLYRLRSQNKVD